MHLRQDLRVESCAQSEPCNRPTSYTNCRSLSELQLFSQKSLTSTVAKEFQIGLCGVVEADLELFCNNWSEGFLRERLYLKNSLAKRTCNTGPPLEVLSELAGSTVRPTPDSCNPTVTPHLRLVCAPRAPLRDGPACQCAAKMEVLSPAPSSASAASNAAICFGA